MSGITTHVLDTSRGRPAAGVVVRLERGGTVLGTGRTDADGRARDLLPPDAGLHAAVYRLVFDTGAYFRERGVEAFYPHVSIDFQVRDPGQHHHVPLLLSTFGYSTYRGI
ncbi:MAG: hydroxyisourate hydrolase [Gemmatimonadetes bacterium]|nr:hydroxyisourate hydrolase [Gemmatimonadota bacterium]